jgi:hypothetical protein
VCAGLSYLIGYRVTRDIADKLGSSGRTDVASSGGRSLSLARPARSSFRVIGWVCWGESTQRTS